MTILSSVKSILLYRHKKAAAPPDGDTAAFVFAVIMR